MSESLQFGQHPDAFEHHLDADQISAFVEQALPAHERDLMLGHLAVCTECRAIVALSLPEVEAPAQPLFVPARKPWWLSWTLALPLAGALAAAVLIFVYHYPTKTAPVASEPQVAIAPAAPLLASPKQPAAPAAQQSQLDLKDSPVESRPAPGGALAGATRPGSNTLASGQAVHGTILAGRNVFPLPPLPAAPRFHDQESPTAAAKAAVAPRPGVVGEIAGKDKAPVNILEPQSRQSAPRQDAPAPTRAVQAAPATVPTANAAETVAVANSAPLDTVSAETSNPEIALDAIQAPPFRRPLPSHRAVLSSASLGKRMVAIDEEHHVFASKDGGKHWKLVSALWQGHAARVDLVHRTVGAALGALSASAAQAVPPGDGGLALKSSGAANAQTPRPASATGSNLNGTVMDRTGAVIPGATVTAIEIATGAANAVKTDAGGHYTIDGLPPGNYRIAALSAGFRKRELASVAIEPTGSVTANLILDVSESTQTVTVEADSAQVGALAKKQTKSRTQSETGPVFEIVTENGDRWTSADGLSWQHN